MKKVVVIYPSRRSQPDNASCPALQAKLARLQLQLTEMRKRAS